MRNHLVRVQATTVSKPRALSLVTNQCQHAHTLVSVASHMYVELFQAIVLMGMVIGLNVAFILKNMNNVVKVGFFRC